MTEGSHSVNFQRFLDSVAGTSAAYREELDLEALLALDEQERRDAEEFLIERLQGSDDWRVPPALTTLETKRAMRPMKARLGEAKGRMKLAIARALIAFKAIERLDETIIEMLDGEDVDDGISALAAADNLSSEPRSSEPRSSEPLIRALARASIHHPGREVRINAGSALLVMAKLDDDPLAWKLRPLYLQLGNESEEVRREAFAEICKLTQLPQTIAD